MNTASKLHEKEGSLLERGLRWDVTFQRRIGVVATVAAGGLAIAGAPSIAVFGTAAFAGGNFAASEIEQRMADSLGKERQQARQRKMGAQATKS